MRASGLLGDVDSSGSVSLESADHVCWVVDDDPETFTEAAVRFLMAGLDRGDRLLWVGDGAAELLRSSGTPLADVDGLTARGVLRLLPVREAYGAGLLDPAEQYRYYDAETRRAVAEGYRGLRVVADVTALAADERVREAFLTWEHLADDLVDHGPGFSAMCAYRRRDVPAEVLADAAARHPVVHAPGAAPPFRAWVDEGRLVVAGELDTFAADRFRRLPAAVPGGGSGAVARLDLTALSFVDLAGVRAVAAWVTRVAERGAAVELVGASRLFRRMWDILGLAGTAGATFAVTG